jgi:hypothetical protein
MTFFSLAQAIVSTAGTILICAAIALIGFGLYVAYLLPRVRRLLADMAEVNRKLDEFQDDLAFAAGFEEFNAGIREHRLVGHPWREFSDTLVPPLPTDPHPVFRNSHDPSHYFNLASLLEGHVNVRFIAAVPGYMTGLGILGTFIGLVAGIYLASLGMNAADVQKMRDALQPLLSGAALAFWTSIVGLICSLIFSVAEKRAFYRIEQAICRWNDNLDRRLRRVTPEQLGAEQIAEASKQTLQLERFNTDLAVSIAKALNAELAHSFAPRFDQLVQGLGDLKNQQVEFSSELLTTVSRDISKSVAGAAGSEMTAVAQTLNSLVTVLQQTAGSLAQGHREMTVAVESIIEKMQGAFGQSTSQLTDETTRAISQLTTYLDAASGAAASNLRTASQDAAGALTGAAGTLIESLQTASGGAADAMLAAAREAAASFAQSAGAIQTSCAQHERSLEKANTVVRATTEAVGALNGVVAALQQTHGAFHTSVQPLQDAIARLAHTQQTVTGQLEQTRQLASSLTDAGEQMKHTLATMQQVWTNHERRFDELDDSAEKFFGQIREGVDAYTTSIRGFVGELDASFSKSLRELSSVVNELDTTVDGLEQVMRRQAV